MLPLTYVQEAPVIRGLCVRYLIPKFAIFKVFSKKYTPKKSTFAIWGNSFAYLRLLDNYHHKHIVNVRLRYSRFLVFKGLLRDLKPRE